MMSCKKIEIENLTVDLLGARPRRILDRLTLEVSGGEALAVVGESGAGKSMTSLAIMGLLPQGIIRRGGEITVNHQPTSGMDRESRWRLRGRVAAMILQNPMSALDPVFTIGAHFAETLASHGEPSRGAAARERAAAALAEVGFDAPGTILGLYPFQMSGGMLQRVMIALALLLDPDFLIADEATTDLDTVSQAQILKILDARRRQRHLGLLLITHDLSVAAAVADRIAVMRHGRVVETGPLAEVFERPSHPYTRQLLQAHRNLYDSRFGGLLERLDAGTAKNGSVACAS
jgi:nickel transport system ATP-binding protein